MLNQENPEALWPMLEHRGRKRERAVAARKYRQKQLLAVPRLLCCSSPPRRDWEGMSIAPAENKARGWEEGCWTGDKLGKGGESALPEVLFSCFSLLLLVTLHTQQSNYKFIN